MTPDLQPSADDFRALTRSSPWLWRRIHLRHRSGSRPGVVDEEVEAWLTRPDGVRVALPDGRRLRPGVSTQRPDGRPTGRWAPPAASYRPDGLVAQRAADDLADDGLFWQDYQWVAMLDPVELSHHVGVTDVREDRVAGRRVWRARLVAEPGYEPRCGGNCCELLYSAAGLHADFGDDLAGLPEGWREHVYPDAYDAAVDVGTGVVVRLHPVGGGDTAPWLENDILDADAELG